MSLFPSSAGGRVPVSARGGILSLVIPLAILGAVFFFVTREKPAARPSPTPASVIAFSPAFERLPPVPGGHYELWVERTQGGGERIGAFTVLPGGSLLGLTGDPVQTFPVQELPPSGSLLLLTVEPGTETRAERSGRVLLRGALQTTEVTLVPVVPELDGNHVAVLLAPTDPAAPDTAGLWFARPKAKTGGKTAPGLGLPAPGSPAAMQAGLAAASGGWAYGGFVTTAGGTVLPMGAFTDPAAPDSAKPFSGPRPGLKLPGEDFLRNAPEGVSFPLNLADGRTSVTVSLLPDFALEAAEPYLPLLRVRIPYRQATNTPFRLPAEKADEAFPRGRGTFEQQPTR